MRKKGGTSQARKKKNSAAVAGGRRGGEKGLGLVRRKGGTCGRTSKSRPKKNGKKKRLNHGKRNPPMGRKKCQNFTHKKNRTYNDRVGGESVTSESAKSDEKKEKKKKNSKGKEKSLSSARKKKKR